MKLRRAVPVYWIISAERRRDRSEPANRAISLDGCCSSKAERCFRALRLKR